MNKNNIFKSKKLFWFLLFIFSLSLLPKVSLGAGGDLIWEKKESLSFGEDIATGMAVDSTGVYTVGSQNSGMVWRVEKRTLDGLGGIDGNGLIWEKKENSFGYDAATGIAVDSTSVYVSGYQNDYDLWRIEKRSLVDGSLIWEKKENLSFGYDVAYGIAVDSTGVYAVGMQNDYDLWRVEKRTLDGLGGIDGNGLIWEKKVRLSFGWDAAAGIAVDSTGVYASGMQNDYDFWRLEKRSLTNGSLIWEKKENLSGDWSISDGLAVIAYEIAVDSTGVYAVETQNDLNLWWVEKRTLDGLGGIDDNGLIWEKKESLSSGWDKAYGIAVDSTGVYVSGMQNDYDLWRVEKRTLDGLGGIDGNGLIWEKKENLSGGYDVVFGMAVDSTGVYASGFQDNFNLWRVEKREKDIAAPINPPTVVTNNATNVLINSATLNGRITNTGGENANQRGFDWGTSSGVYPNNWTQNGNYGTGAFNRGITGLAPSTTYYFRAKARNSAGWGYGAELSFTTAAAPINPPTVVTNNATNVLINSATLNGRITNTGGENANQRGFDWGTSSGVYPNNWTQNGNYGTGAFNRGITGLAPSTTYYFRAKARNSAGWGYGAELSFTTAAALPTFQDIGLRVRNGSGVTVSIAAEIGVATSPLRIAKNGTVYGIALVNPGDVNDSGVRIQTANDGLKALRRL